MKNKVKLRNAQRIASPDASKCAARVSSNVMSKIKKIRLTIVLVSMIGITLPIFAQYSPITVDTIENKRKEIWKDFHKVRFNKFGKFQKINLYAENNPLTKICFICDQGLFIYYHKDPNHDGLSHIDRVEHAKSLVYDRINRITYEKWKDLGFFRLWYYETEELSIGSD
jgi:hypothetical protein